MSPSIEEVWIKSVEEGNTKCAVDLVNMLLQCLKNDLSPPDALRDYFVNKFEEIVKTPGCDASAILNLKPRVGSPMSNRFGSS